MKNKELKKYPKYKPSGVEWIGEIPEEWGLNKLKYLTDNLDSKRVPLSSDQRGLKQGEYPYYGATGIIDNINEYLFDGDYVLVGEDGAPFFISNRNVAFKATGKFWVNNHAHILKCKNEINEEILVHQLNLVDYKLYITGSTRDKLTQSDLSNIILIDIPIPEQTAIANYLYDKTAKIDTLIEKKKKLIELLKEERTAVINQAVTKGLNHDSHDLHDYRDKKNHVNPLIKVNQGSDNLPKHWQVKKLKYVVSKVGSGVTPRGGANVYQIDGIPLLRSQNIYTDRLRLDDVAFISEEIDEEMSNSRIFENDVLLNITGASIGRCFYVPKGFGKGNVNQHVCIIRPQLTKILTEYLHIILISGYGQALIDFCQNGANREGLNFQQIRSFALPLPDIDEQEKIVQHIETETERIDNTVSKIKKEIELLAEYRTALISEVVTGKIKV